MTEIAAVHLQEEFLRTRDLSAQLTSLLTPEDQLLQSMPEASPVKWHLAHTTWFFDTFLLKPRHIKLGLPTQFELLFNSYYNQLGPQFPRPQRGLLSRPSLAEVWQYRSALDNVLSELISDLTPQELLLVKLGISHEQQHQELIVTDVKHALSFNPLAPSIVEPYPTTQKNAPALTFINYNEGNYSIGSNAIDVFDNESPQHQVYLNGFSLANRPITNHEYLQFIEDGGYSDARHWLSDGWSWINKTQAQAPLYWMKHEDEWHHYTLAGARPLAFDEPVCHVNFYEASAFAQWAGKRLPTEFEWEVAARQQSLEGNFLAIDRLHPQPAPASEQYPCMQLFGDVWEWTQSAYLPYPGFCTRAGAIGEYNGKFMVNQWVLRGGSCATPAGHIRPSYRNFFPVNASWQFSGVRLADDLG